VKRKKLGRLAYRTGALARTVGISRSIIYEEIRDGKLLARKCHGCTIILRSDAIRWLESLPLLQRKVTPRNATSAVIDAEPSREIKQIPPGAPDRRPDRGAVPD
jgi:hypothetical protein